jgi:hypothetical protein
LENQNPRTEGQQQGKPNLSEEQQELYDIFVSQGTMLAAKAADQLKGQDQNTPGIVGTVGDAMSDIINKVEDDGAKHGIQFDEVSMVHGSAEIMTNLLNMSGIKLTDEQKKQVAGHAIGRYFNEAMQSGKMPKERLMQYGQQIQQMNQEGGPSNG